MKTELLERSQAVDDEYMRRANGRITCTDKARFYSLALCGEAGELANKIKKQWRGDVDAEGYDKYLKDVAYELADVLLYAHHLANELGIDLDAVIAEKIAIVEGRLWGDK